MFRTPSKPSTSQLSIKLSVLYGSIMIFAAIFGYFKMKAYISLCDSHNIDWILFFHILDDIISMIMYRAG